MDKEELSRLAYIRVAQAVTLLAQAGEDLLAEEAEALAEKVDLVEAAVRA
jgi:carbon monoxide dehydrogenase subunit G